MEYNLTKKFAVLVRPKQACLNYLVKVEPKITKIELENIKKPEIYLACDFTSKELWVEKNYFLILNEFLLAWYEDKSTWPSQLSLQLFLDWFEVEFIFTVWEKDEDS